MSDSALSPNETRRREWRAFLFLTVVLFPLLSVLLVSALGFVIWFYQMIFGPPGV